MPKNNKPELIAGHKFNKLTILALSHSDKRWRKWYKVKCDCGVEKVVLGASLVSGNTKSCGCLGTELRKARRISGNHTEITAIILGYKRHAINRGFEWILSREQVKEIIKKDCLYCGSPPTNKKKTKNSIEDKGLLYSGIDRIDSSKDYTEDNCVPCCRVCNYAKSNMDIKEFQAWAIKLGKKAMAEQWG